MTFTASGIFYPTLRDVLQNDTAVDLTADSLKAALFTNSLATPNFDTNTAYGVAPWNANEVTSAGYTAGGLALTTKVITVEAGSKLTFDADDLVWSGVTFTARGCLIYDDTIATPVAKPAIVAVTFGADFPVTAGTFTVAWNAPASGGVWNIDLP